jgi:hypothetical protein
MSDNKDEATALLGHLFQRTPARIKILKIIETAESGNDGPLLYHLLSEGEVSPELRCYIADRLKPARGQPQKTLNAKYKSIAAKGPDTAAVLANYIEKNGGFKGGPVNENGRPRYTQRDAAEEAISFLQNRFKGKYRHIDIDRVVDRMKRVRQFKLALLVEHLGQL